MLSEKLIAESVTLNMLNVDIEQFLSASLYESLVESVLIILPKSQQFKKVSELNTRLDDYYILSCFSRMFTCSAWSIAITESM